MRKKIDDITAYKLAFLTCFICGGFLATGTGTINSSIQDASILTPIIFFSLVALILIIPLILGKMAGFYSSTMFPDEYDGIGCCGCFSSILGFVYILILILIFC